MYGEIPGFDDVDHLRKEYMMADHPGLRKQILGTIERHMDDLLGVSQKVALSGYDMREWRRRLTVPFDAEFNSLITDYAEAIQSAQDGVFKRKEFNDKLKLSGRKSPPGYSPWQS